MIAKIRALLGAVELGSLKAAGEALGCTQSAVSHSIASLEASIARDSAYNASLVDNPDQLEILGRVNYYMKRDNEDIFVIRDNKK